MNKKLCPHCGRDVTCRTCNGYGRLSVDIIRTNGIRTELLQHDDPEDCTDCDNGWAEHNCPEYRTFRVIRRGD